MSLMVVSPLVALLSGIAILIWPRLLNYIVAFYLVLFGALGLSGAAGAVASHCSRARGPTSARQPAGRLHFLKQ